jgi:hypothetical protein
MGYLEMDGGEAPGEESYMEPDDPCFGKPWGYIDPAEIGDDRPTAAKSLLGTDNPLDVVESLELAGAELVAAGRVSVRGADVDAYTVDPIWMGDDAPFDSAEAGVSLKAMKVAVDGQGRLVQLDYTTRHDLVSSDRRTIVELWDFGVRVDVQKPPAADTCDFMASFGRSMDEFD